jgi:hypothetical protein
MINVIKRQDELAGIKYLKLSKSPKPQSTNEQIKNLKIENLNQRFSLDKEYQLEDYMLDLSNFCKNFKR